MAQSIRQIRQSPTPDSHAEVLVFPAVSKSQDVRYIVVSASTYKADQPGTLQYLRIVPLLKCLASFSQPGTTEVDPSVFEDRPSLRQFLQEVDNNADDPCTDAATAWRQEEFVEANLRTETHQYAW